MERALGFLQGRRISVAVGDLARHCLSIKCWVMHNATQFSHLSRNGETVAG